ncbi:MAG: glutamine synthetase type III [Myxococcales bacterium]|nr:glutamine synthetase type III [Myxococcales bacterium]
MSNSRAQAIAAIASYQSTVAPLDHKVPTGELFGQNVFGHKAMQEHLPKPVYKSLLKTIETGATLDPEVADTVAAAMKDWAIAKGATHYAHVFYPLTGWTAEKHDSFLSPGTDGRALAEFAGKTLIQGEPDASSFPNGGIRGTHEARGYTAWDVTSPAYLIENPNGVTLCIPTVFVSWTGEALDKKTPVLRSIQALNKQAQRVLKLFGHDDIAAVNSFAGPEQEYFLVDTKFYTQRPDLMLTGRTLFGAPSGKGQEFDDHYFGIIPERVLAYMMEVERELFKLGIPVKTRHNEVAPGQFECAPVYEAANVASDHQQLVMATLKRVATKYGLACSTHEKPFKGLNGSGKHVNYSFGNSTQGNLLDPGDTPHENMQFLVFCAAVIRGVDKYAPVLRATIASAGNDHRLGANEAPPAIISIFLGDQLTDVFEQIKAGGAKSSKAKGTLEIGVDTLPKLPKDAGDRNRTSPFAFTGNRFEFRAVGGNQSISGPLVALNTIFAESLDFCATELEKSLASGMELKDAVQVLLKGILDKHDRVIFNGNGYSAEWHAEAEKRGLPNLRTTPDALTALDSEETRALFDKHKVLSPRELASRYETYVEQYIKSILLEARIALRMAKTTILPAALRYQSELGAAAVNVKGAGLSPDLTVLTETTELVGALQAGIAKLAAAIESEHEEGMAGALYCRDTVIPAMNAVRDAADKLETVIADDLWPLPTYQEMLFIK